MGSGEMSPRPHFVKPKCKLVGLDGNVFVLAGAVRQALKRAKYPGLADEFTQKLYLCKSYGEALALMQEYVEAE